MPTIRMAWQIGVVVPAVGEGGCRRKRQMSMTSPSNLSRKLFAQGRRSGRVRAVAQEIEFRPPKSFANTDDEIAKRALE
jgi:hypothetical protein